mgnify:CR=1 FL=1
MIKVFAICVETFILIKILSLVMTVQMTGEGALLIAKVSLKDGHALELKPLLVV